MRRIIAVLGALVLASGLSVCGYNQIQSLDEATKSSEAEVASQYHRRSDLVPNLGNTLKGVSDQ